MGLRLCPWKCLDRWQVISVHIPNNDEYCNLPSDLSSEPSLLIYIRLSQILPSASRFSPNFIQPTSGVLWFSGAFPQLFGHQNPQLQFEVPSVAATCAGASTSGTGPGSPLTALRRRWPGQRLGWESMGNFGAIWRKDMEI